MSRVWSRGPALLSWRDLRVRVAPELAGIGAGDHVALTFDDGPAERVRRDLRGGGTVLLHDSDITAAPGSWRSALGAIDQVIDRCAEQGWRIGPLADHGIGRE